MNIIGRFTSELPIEILFCNKHGETRFALSGTKRPRWKCLECSSDFSYSFKKRNKQKSVDYMGGKCLHCGYDECLSAMHFHHVNSENKSFNINQGIARKWEVIRSELDKCILLCMNCHFKEHERLDFIERSSRKDIKIPSETYHRKEINRINSDKLGVKYQP